MSYRTTIALVALLIILAGAVYYVQGQPSPQSAATPSRPAVISFAPADATKLIVASGDKSTEVDRVGTAWNLVKPESTPADQARVQGWIDQLGTLTADRVLDNVSDLSSYGLSQPKMNLEVDLTGGKSVTLAFGDKTPDGASYYVRLPNDPAKAKSVYLISAPLGDDLTSALAKPPKALPTPTPLPALSPAPTLNVPTVGPTPTP